MRSRAYRLADYRLAAYVVVAAAIAGGVAFGLDRAFAPTSKVEANGAPLAAAANSGAVRQIPIARTSTADLGDPDGKLTPVYPTSPGKDLPIKDTPVVQAAKPAPSPVAQAPTAATSGSASASAGVQPTPTPAPAPARVANANPVSMTAEAPNACNVAACAAAYRSFRESDCSYQPMVGARRTCEGAPGLGGPSSTGPVASQPPAHSQPQARAPFDPRTVPVVRGRYDDALRDAERAVRRLPPPGAFADDDPRGVIVMEAPEQRYELRRNWVSEPQD